MAYTTKEKIEAYLGETISTTLTDYIQAVTNWIDLYTGTTFEAETGTKLYDGLGGKEIITDDFINLTKIEILDRDGDILHTLDSDDDWYLYPANSDVKNRIVINSANAPISVFYKRNQNVKVYADFGYSEDVPDDIALAATILVGNILKDNDVDLKDKKSEKIGNYSVTYKDIEAVSERLKVNSILDHYKRFLI
ncbi:MAG: hypothetical protein ACOC5T_07270 [Elusimicrobiota bacterium]